MPLVDRIAGPFRRLHTRTAIAGLLTTTCLPLPAVAQDRPVDAARAQPTPDSLATAFADPPASARPRVWWHWMDGNITQDGIRKDLEWMKRVGIAGAQTFDASLVTPQIVDTRLIYMTPAWKDAFRFAASEADRLGLELAIASSPGWSQTGGPWVKPEDAMKKVAWSETVVPGGRRFFGTLPRPPEISGPFQDAVVKNPLEALEGKKPPAPSLYRDTAVIAYRIAPGADRPIAFTASLAGKPLDAAALADGSFATRVTVPKGSPGTPTIIDLTLPKAQTARSLSLFVPGAADQFSKAAIKPRLEASDDGATWRKVAEIRLTTAPTTISFAPVTARLFRVVLAYDPTVKGLDLSPAPGFDLAPLVKLFAPSPTFEIADLRLSPEARVNQWEAKAGFSTAYDYYALDGSFAGDATGLATSDIIDLTHKVSPDGMLDWTPPRGTWRIVRMGWSLTGKMNHPATPEATGLEVDKLDATAVRNYLQTYLGLYRDAAGAKLIGARGVQALLTDSTEVGAFNWTPQMLDQFRRLRGYDPRPWLPALTGAIVGSRVRTDGFLYDYRRTIAELHTTEHYGTVAAVAHENGLKVYGESLEGIRPTLGDDLDMRRYTDVPMAAQWTYPPNGKPKPNYEADIRGAASVAHFYGQNLVAAESMTSVTMPWAYAPSDLRRVIDLEFASGVNRPIIHTSVHVPRDDRQPGLSLFIFGQYFNRMESWAEMARPWIDYMARSSLLLQSGKPVADVAYFYGEEAPIGAMSLDALPADLPKSHGYDFVSAQGVLNDLTVTAGDLVAPSGLHYRALYLGGSSGRMTLPMLRRIAALAEQGATVIGDAPKGSPSLDDATPEYRQLVGRLWAGGAVTQVGQGRVVAGRDPEQGLARAGVTPDFTLVAPENDAHVMFVHRRLADGDIYFVDNRRNLPQRIEARFRVTDKAPEIWRADSGASAPLSYRMEGDTTVVPLDFAADQSFFVVFRKPAAAPARTVAPESTRVIGQVEGPWAVTFQPGRGAPASLTLPALGSLSEQADTGVRYFSGVATYRKTIKAPADYTPGSSLLLDLGKVGDLAEVRVNGQLAGTVWHAPYRIDIGRLLKRGANRLDVRVANLWVNRLIGDAQPGATKITFTATPTFRATAPLRPSGLIGPVQLLTTNR